MTGLDASPAVIATGVTRDYGNGRGLAGVDIEVERGEIVAVLGPNGAGKTTLVEILEGLRRPDDGVIRVLGEDPGQAGPAWRARIGAVLQLGTETDELTVDELLRSYAAYYPRSRSIEDVVGLLDLSALLQRRVNVLSGGQRRRVDVALGIVGDPELVFLDEPTTGLDPEVRRSIWSLVRALAENGTTVLLTTHYLDEVEYLADRTMVLVAGTSVWNGPTHRLEKNGLDERRQLPSAAADNRRRPSFPSGGRRRRRTPHHRHRRSESDRRRADVLGQHPVSQPGRAARDCTPQPRGGLPRPSRERRTARTDRTMTSQPTHPPRDESRGTRSRVVQLGLLRARLEIIGLLRSKDAVIFSLALPVMLLVLFGSIFSDTLEGTSVTVGQWFTPGIIAASVLSAGFVNLATSMAMERHDGTLRRLALTPLPISAYLIGKVFLTFALAAGMTLVLLVVGVVAFGVDLPSDAGDWRRSVGCSCWASRPRRCSGSRWRRSPRSAKSAAVVFTPPFLFLQFISGVFIEFGTLPPWMRTFAGLFPLRWLAAGMRSVFLPGEFEGVGEPGGSYDLEVGAMVLISWVVVGFVVAVRTFRFGRERPLVERNRP